MREVGIFVFCCLSGLLVVQEDRYLQDPLAINLVLGAAVGLIGYVVLLVIRFLTWCVMKYFA